LLGVVFKHTTNDYHVSTFQESSKDSGSNTFIINVSWLQPVWICELVAWEKESGEGQAQARINKDTTLLPKQRIYRPSRLLNKHAQCGTALWQRNPVFLIEISAKISFF